MKIAYRKVVCVLLLLVAETLMQHQNISDLHDGTFFKMFKPPPKVPYRIEPPAIKGNGHPPCTLADGTIGACYSSFDCAKRRGRIIASCGEGQGLCCMVERSCSHITKEMVSYFVNPNYPNLDTKESTCVFRIDVANRNVCQVRVDFEKFSLAGPHWKTGNCHVDRFMPSTSYPRSILLSQICGENAGHHIFIPVDSRAEVPFVSLMVMATGVQPFGWRFRNTQIDCLRQPNLAAPHGCLQYYDTLVGTIQSFNYKDGKGSYQNNLDYAICIKRGYETCRVRYRQVENSSFWINSADGGKLSEGIGQAGDFNCDTSSHDYLYIAGGRTTTDDDAKDDGSWLRQPIMLPAMSDKFCGRSLSGLAVDEYVDWLKSDKLLYPLSNLTVASAVTSYASGPIILRFHTDTIVNATQELGFNLVYEQLSTGCEKHFK